MRELNENNLVVNNNSLLFTYRYLTAKIIPVQSDGNISFYLNVWDSVNRRDFRLFFATLEGAIDFVKNVVSKSMRLENVINRYKESITVCEIDHQMCLNEPDIFSAIYTYYCSNNRNIVSLHKELSIENGNPKVYFYMLQEIKIGNRLVETKIYLTEDDLKKVINNTYLKNSGHEVLSFEYIGGINYAKDIGGEDKPYFDGLKVYSKDIVKDSTLSMKYKEKEY